MKKITLLRHAKADWASGLDDFEIPLTEKGVQDAKNMGKILLEESIVPDHIICSAAVRALTTARLLIKPLLVEESNLVAENLLHNASASCILEYVQRLPQKPNHIMVIAHNPGISELASLFAGNPISLSTCDSVTFSLNIQNWLDCGFDCSKLQKIIRNPKIS